MGWSGLMHVAAPVASGRESKQDIAIARIGRTIYDYFVTNPSPGAEGIVTNMV
jgi:hypothetical protein